MDDYENVVCIYIKWTVDHLSTYSLPLNSDVSLALKLRREKFNSLIQSTNKSAVCWLLWLMDFCDFWVLKYSFYHQDIPNKLEYSLRVVDITGKSSLLHNMITSTQYLKPKQELDLLGMVKRLDAENATIRTIDLQMVINSVKNGNNSFALSELVNLLNFSYSIVAHHSMTDYMVSAFQKHTQIENLIPTTLFRTGKSLFPREILPTPYHFRMLFELVFQCIISTTELAETNAFLELQSDTGVRLSCTVDLDLFWMYGFTLLQKTCVKTTRATLIVIMEFLEVDGAMQPVVSAFNAYPVS